MAQYRIDRNQYLNDGKTIFEVQMLSDKLTAGGGLVDAFGRLRVGTPFTLFDSSHRYQLNDKWSTANTGNATMVYLQSESSVMMNVATANGDKMVRETKRVFPYQPGKSLLTVSSFKFENPKANLTQRIGYFGANNGIYFENDGVTNYFVMRSNTTSSVVETRVAQANWNFDTFSTPDPNTGAANSAYALSGHGTFNVAKTQIFFTDIEWLGVGDVRCGFYVDGKPMIGHIFHSENQNEQVYMQTSILPVRQEIFNTGITSGNSSMKQICSTVISEGGYQGRSKTYAAGTNLSLLKSLPSGNTFYPVVSLRLSPNTLDAVILPTSFDILTATNNVNYRYKIVKNATLGNTDWQNHYTNTAQFDIGANNVITDGEDLNLGYLAQGSFNNIDTLGSLEDLNLQLGRTLGGVSDTITIAVEGDKAASVGAIIRWNDLT